MSDVHTWRRARLETLSTGERVVLKVSGVVDLSTCPVLLREVRSASRTARGLDVDVADVEYLGGTGIGILSRAHRRLDRRGVELRLRCPQPGLRRAFEDVGLAAALLPPDHGELVQ